MSIADHFEHAPDASFVRDYDSGTARRQFKVSLLLIAVIALAASALGFLVRFDSPAAVGVATDIVAPPSPGAPPAYAGRL